jgi:hypothetical protein
MPKQPGICWSDTVVAGPGPPRPPAIVVIVPDGGPELPAPDTDPAAHADPAGTASAAVTAAAAAVLMNIAQRERFIKAPSTG